MKKIVIKTSLITIACIFCAFIVLFFALFFFSPVTVGKLFDDMGSYSVSVYFYERQYNKTEKTEDLATLVFKLDEEKDFEKTFNFSDKMIKSVDFDAYCNQKDQKEQGGRTGNFISTKEFVLGKFSVSAYLNNAFPAFKVTAENFVLENGYTFYNPYRILLSRTGKNIKAEDLTDIKDILDVLKNEKFGTELTLINSDISYIEGLLNG